VVTENTETERQRENKEPVASLNFIIWMQITISFPLDYLNQSLHTVCQFNLRLLLEELLKTLSKGIYLLICIA